ncbi:anti-sigma regulatory factor (Ser/Thr protein kinase) [Streptacidiphilus sp. MAP12-20]|uniref:ATP-binding protein n=1 Tax=Streptacidiphilus sp. MAP12-20 TaxID=3156299 RepID=UPI0035191458
MPAHLAAQLTLSASLTMPALTCSVTRARRAFTALYADHAAAEDGRLLLSEAVANAVEHTDAEQVRVVIQHHPPSGRLVCAVHDSGPAVPTSPAQTPGADAESGRGLHLIESLSEAWGHLVRPDGKWTWFSLRPSEALS